MRRPAVALIDGEHYPPVVIDALRQLSDRFEFRGALFLGGGEKITVADLESEAKSLYGLPVVFDGDWPRGLARVIRDFKPEIVVDLSDEPVLGYEQRFRLISECLAREVSYVGSDFHFSPATSDRLCTSPSLAIIGTGKRVGKTAVSGFVARALQEVVVGRDGAPAVVVVAMGRGGPAEPEIVRGAGGRVTVADLLDQSRQGRHAASDHFEDAVLSRVTTVGCRRCGGGMAGQPFVSNVAAGVELANSLDPALIVLEGSGAAVPPVGADARLLVAGAHQPPAHVTGYLTAYRVLVSDGVVLTMAEEPLASADRVRSVVESIREIKPGIEVVPVVFRPQPLESVEGKKVAFFSTAPAVQKAVLGRHLEEEYGCKVRLVSTSLADRTALRRDLERPEMSGVEVFLTEIKAAAIDVVAEAAEARGVPVVPVDNAPVETQAHQQGRLTALAEELAEMAGQRFKDRA